MNDINDDLKTKQDLEKMDEELKKSQEASVQSEALLSQLNKDLHEIIEKTKEEQRKIDEEIALITQDMDSETLEYIANVAAADEEVAEQAKELIKEKLDETDLASED